MRDILERIEKRQDGREFFTKRQKLSDCLERQVKIKSYSENE